MYTEDVTVDYQGFKPNQSLLKHMKSMTDHLYYEAPSESCIKASFSRVGKVGYMGMVKINSSVGSFVAKALGDDLDILGDKLFKQVRDQLKEWKTTRFMEPSLACERYGKIL